MIDKKLMAVPGPTPVVSSIRREMAREISAFGDPDFIADYKQTVDRLCGLLNCSGKAFVLAGTGTLAMEMAIANTTRPGDDVLVVSHGYFGERFAEICRRKGRAVDLLQAEAGKPVSLLQIEAQLSQKSYAALTLTHVDTATGVAAPLALVGELMRSYPDTLFIVDGVSATGAEPEDFDAMGIDLLFCASQKAFGVCPGLLVLWASEQALQRRSALGSIPEYYVDFENWMPVMEDPAHYFATPPINLIWALRESVRLIAEETLPDRCRRHRRNAKAMQKAFEALGFSILADKQYRAVTLSNLLFPPDLEDGKFRSILAEEGVVAATGLGEQEGKLLRIAHMGNIDMHEMTALLCALERALHRVGKLHRFGQGVEVYLEEMARKF